MSEPVGPGGSRLDDAHVSTVEMAEADEGLLDPVRSSRVAAHLAACAACARTAAELREVSQLLRALPPPPLPEAVAERLQHVVEAEQRRMHRPMTSQPAARRSGGAPTLTAAGQRSRSSRILFSLAAAVTLTVGFGLGGYVVSGSAGWNEPPTASVSVDSASLGPQAAAVAAHTDLKPHRFSRAWTCARKVTDGTITGLATVAVDGGSALLVYVGSGSTETVTLVTGCDRAAPVAAASTRLSR